MATTTNNTIEKISPVFTDLLIKKIESLKSDWQKPWITSLKHGFPRNLRGTVYNGGNILMLLFYTEFMKFTLPVFLTSQSRRSEHKQGRTLVPRLLLVQVRGTQGK